MEAQVNVYVSRTNSNIFIVCTDLQNKPLKIISGGMVKIKGLNVRRKKVFFGTVNFMAEYIAKFILSSGLTDIDVFFSNGCRNYLYIILQRFCNLGLNILNLNWRLSVSFNGCKKRKKKRR